MRQISKKEVILSSREGVPQKKIEVVSETKGRKDNNDEGEEYKIGKDKYNIYHERLPPIEKQV